MHRLCVIALLVAACGGEVEDSSPGAAALAPFKVKLETTKGDILIEVRPDWAPIGAHRFRELVEADYFTDVAFFRVVSNFMVQFGMHGDPQTNRKWAAKNLADEPVRQPNLPGYISYAKQSLPNTRSNQLFINTSDNRDLDGQGFSPIGRVQQGMAVVLSLYAGYGERSNRQEQITSMGNDFLKRNFPRLDYIKRATIVE